MAVSSLKASNVAVLVVAWLNACVAAPVENDSRKGATSGDSDAGGEGVDESGASGSVDGGSKSDLPDGDGGLDDDASSGDAEGDGETETNEIPTFSDVDFPELFVHVPTQFQLVAEDSEGEPLSIDCDPVCPAGLTIESGGIAHWTPTTAGVHQWSFTASDGETLGRKEVSATVKGLWSSTTVQTIEQLGFEADSDWNINEFSDGLGTTYKLKEVSQIFDQSGFCSSNPYCPYTDWYLQKKVGSDWVDVELLAQTDDSFNQIKMSLLSNGRLLFVYSSRGITLFDGFDAEVDPGVRGLVLENGNVSVDIVLSAIPNGPLSPLTIEPDAQGGAMVFYQYDKARRFNGSAWFPQVSLGNTIRTTCSDPSGKVAVIFDNNTARIYSGAWAASQVIPSFGGEFCVFGPKEEPLLLWSQQDVNTGFVVLYSSVHSDTGWSSKSAVTSPTSRHQLSPKARPSSLRMPLVWREKLDGENASVWTSIWNGTSWSLPLRLDPDQDVDSRSAEVYCEDNCRRIAARWVEGPDGDTSVIARLNE